MAETFMGVLLELVTGLIMQTGEAALFVVAKILQLLNIASAVGGFGGFVLTVVVFGIIIFFALRFFLHSAGMVIVLVIALFIILMVVGYNSVGETQMVVESAPQPEP